MLWKWRTKKPEDDERSWSWPVLMILVGFEYFIDVFAVFVFLELEIQ